MSFFELHADRFRRAAIPAALAALVLFCQPALAQQPVNPKTWMADQSDYIADIPMKGIAMLGTHDAAMYIEPSNADLAKTQVWDFPGQLDRGVRWFDTRIVRLDASFTQPDRTSSCTAVTGAILPYPGPGYYMYGHGGLCTGVTLPTVLDQISQWLDQHPKEILILELVGGQTRLNTPGYSYTNPDVNDVNSEFAFLAVFDQHLRRASDHASYIYDRPTACALAGSQYTSTGLYQGACKGSLIHPQEVTPQQLWTTPARVILLEQFSLDISLPPGIFPQFTWNDLDYQTKDQEPANERITGSFSTGTIDPNLLFDRLENGSVADNDNVGLYGYRPAYQSYEADGRFLSLQAELTPNGVGIDGITAPRGPVGDAEVFNPMLNSALQTTWQPYSVNIVSIDDADDENVLANVVAYNQQTFGRAPSGTATPTQITVGRDGTVYKLANGVVWKRVGFTGQSSDWAQTGYHADRIAVDPSGKIWALSGGLVSLVNSTGLIYRTQGYSGTFQDIAAGTDGAIYTISSAGDPYRLVPSSNFSSITATLVSGIHNLTSIAAGPANTLTAVDTSGTVWRYTSNGNWTNINKTPNSNPISLVFLASSVTVDEAGDVWATERESPVAIIRRPLTSFVIPFSKVWGLVNGNWFSYREDGVQMSAGASGTNGVEIVYALSYDGLLHSLRYSPSTGLGAQAPPPKRYVVNVSVSGLSYNHATKLFTGTLTVANDTASPITDQLAVVFQGLSPGVTVANNPLTYQDLPFILMPTVSLQPGNSTSAQVQFSNPNLVNINYLTQVFAYVAGS